jgi:hypothetical protein
MKGKAKAQAKEKGRLVLKRPAAVGRKAALPSEPSSSEELSEQVHHYGRVISAMCSMGTVTALCCGPVRPGAR